MRRTCPGIDDRLRPKPEYITCHNCGGDVEIWTDEEKAECSDCGARISRSTQSCLDWCEHAQMCKVTIVKEKLREVPT